MAQVALTPTWLSSYFIQHSLYGCFIAFDPNSESFFDDANAYLDNKLGELWLDLKSYLPAADEVMILRNLWALAVDDAESLAVLVRLGAQHRISAGWSLVVSEMQRALIDGCLPHSWALFLAGIESRFSLLPVGKHTDAFRLRYQLAILNRENASSFTILRLWPSYKKLSRLAYQRELTRSIAGAAAAGRPWPKISLAEFNRLSVDERYLLTSSGNLFNYFLGAATQSRIDVAGVETLRQRLQQTRLVIRKMITSLKWGNYQRVTAMVPQLDVNGLEIDLKRQFSKELIEAIKAPSHLARGGYDPLGPIAISLIRKLAGKIKTLEVLALGSEEIVQALQSKKIVLKTIPPGICLRLKRTWSTKQIDTLCALDAFPLIDKIPERCTKEHGLRWIVGGFPERYSNVKGALAEFGWDEHQPNGIEELWLNKSNRRGIRYLRSNDELRESELVQKHVLRSYGLVETKGLIDDGSISAIKALANYLLSAENAFELDAFRQKLASKLFRYLGKSGFHRSLALGIGEDLCKKDHQFARLFVTGLAEATINSLLASNLAPLWLVPLVGIRPDKEVFDELCQRLIVVRSSNASDVLDSVEKRPELAALLTPQRLAESSLQHRDDGLVLAILCLRRHVIELKKLSSSTDPREFTRACQQAARISWLNIRDSAYLGILSVIGAKWARLLAAGVSSMHFNSPSGHKLDHCYRSFEVPKNSGGTRTITAPPRLIKRLQRELLDNLITPLGAHSSSHGFVNGRSILTNATHHVGKQVVANCDIQSCFPSTRWGLVLAALRRDFETVLPQASISLLVDICTFNGGLPVGAPTSPAILNRVLLQSDIWIAEAAAKREITYTRYADDFTFSGGEKVPEMIAITRQILSRIGYKLDYKKTQIYRKGRRKIVTGLVVNEQVSVPRAIRRRVRAAVHAQTHGRMPTWNGEDESLDSLTGRAQFVRSINKREGEQLLAKLRYKPS